jgi:hypothetical protein
LRTHPQLALGMAYQQHVQVVEYIRRKMIILIHIGSAHNEEEILSLKEIASEWILKNDKQTSLFSILDRFKNL